MVHFTGNAQTLLTHLFLAMLVDELMARRRDDRVEDGIFGLELGVRLDGVETISAETIQLVLQIRKNWRRQLFEL